MKKDLCTNDNYPSWTCLDCAQLAGGQVPKEHLPTWHMGTCPICGEYKPITEPRDFGHPAYQYVVSEND